VKLLDFLAIKIDHMSSKILVARGLFLKKISFKLTISHETSINRGTPNSFYINSSSIETLPKSLHKLSKNFKISKVETSLDPSLKAPK
jgi:hypothetical protein